MKKIILLSFLCSTTLGFSQNAPIDFEPDGFGADWTWATFEAPEGEENPDFSVVANVATDGINSSANVARIDISYPTDASWGQAGCESMHGADIGTFSITEANSTVRVMVYQEGFASPVALKFAAPDGAAFFEQIAQNDVADAWVEVEFDMSEWMGDPLGQPDQIIFFPSYGPRETGHTVYFDNVEFGPAGPPAGEPMVSAPDPTIDEDLVISAYSDFYQTNTVTGFNLNSFQGAGTISEIDIESDGNNTLKIEGLTFYGAEWDAVDLTDYLYVHLDYWTGNSTAFNFYLIDATAGIPGGAAEEPRYSFAAAGADATIVEEEWVSVFIPLQHFLDYPSTGFSYDLEDIFQWKFDGNGTLFIDNVYFTTEEVMSVESLRAEGIQLFPNPAQDFWNVQSENSAIEQIQVFNALGQVVWSATPNANVARIQASELKPGLYIAQVKTALGFRTMKLVRE
ncbi:MAG TPA: T9SS type A sorting domain-containing protein [Cryomorphaceae bacterium]|nr:T9SS type A sorting domain-containing protein [Cryomorphaceae bacterium]